VHGTVASVDRSLDHPAFRRCLVAVAEHVRIPEFPGGSEQLETDVDENETSSEPGERPVPTTPRVPERLRDFYPVRITYPLEFRSKESESTDGAEPTASREASRSSASTSAACTSPPDRRRPSSRSRLIAGGTLDTLPGSSPHGR
jgi:hypothetical protein